MNRRPRVHAVVSPLDEPATERFLGVTRSIEAALPPETARIAQIPNVSYHLACEYQLDRLPRALRSIADRTSGVSSRTSGIGMFLGNDVVVYLPVVRSPELSAVHVRVRDAARALVAAPSDDDAYYEPGSWTPHITLARIPRRPEVVSAVMSGLVPLNLAWDLTIRDLALIASEAGQQEIIWRAPLAG